MKATKSELERITRRIVKARRRLERKASAHEMAVVARLAARLKELELVVKCTQCQEPAVANVYFYGGYEEVLVDTLCDDHTSKAERQDDWMKSEELTNG